MLKFEVAETESTINTVYYRNDKELPVYSSSTSGFTAGTLAQILMDKTIKPERVCHVQPMGVNPKINGFIHLSKSTSSISIVWCFLFLQPQT